MARARAVTLRCLQRIPRSSFAVGLGNLVLRRRGGHQDNAASKQLMEIIPKAAERTLRYTLAY
jgi:hypothetical protein